MSITSVNFHEVDQIIVMANIQKILQYHQNMDKDVNPYNNLISIDSNNPELTFNKVLSVDPKIYQFYNELTNLQKSFLVPKIKIYRKNDQNEDESLLFGNHFDAYEFNDFVLNPQKIQTLTDENGNTISKNNGVGLKSITISDRSERPVDVNISCKMELFFQDILSLTNSDFLKLVTSPEIRSGDESIDFRIKLVIGWETPNDASQLVFTPEMIEIIESSNVVYLLQLTTHTIDILDNGSVKVDIEYIGALEKYFGTHSSMDILDVTNLEKLKLFAPTTDGNPHISDYTKAVIELKDLELQLKKLTNSSDKVKNKSEFEIKTSENEDSKIKELEEKIEKVTRKISELELYVIKDKYARILKSVTESNRIFYLTIPYSIMDILYEKDKQSAETYDAIISVIQTTSIPQKLEYSSSGNASVDDIKTFNKKINNVWEDFTQEAADKKKAIDAANSIDSEDESLEERLGKIDTDDLGENLPSYNALKILTQYQNLQNKLAAQFGSWITNTTVLPEEIINSRFIHYVRLGDIINSVVSFLDIPPDIDIVFGPCKIGNLNLNILNLPIAISAFSVWFINKVVKETKRKYFLWDFITDIFRDLVIPNLTGIEIFGQITSSLTVSTSTIYSDKKLPRGGRYLDDSIRSSLSRNVKNPANIYQYLIIYIYDFQLNQRDGILEEDTRDGIYHFGIGRNRGIVKNIKFNKIDFARLRDLRIVGNKLNTPGELLREHYNINLMTYGSPIFMNGASLYFDGSFMGLLGREITEKLGLGGYYLITGIETTISQDTYETSVALIWNSMRKNSAENKASQSVQITEKERKVGIQND